MKVGITQQPEISPAILKLIDFIEIKTVTTENLDYYSQFKQPFSLHLQNIGSRSCVFIGDQDVVELVSQPVVKTAIRNSAFSFFSFHLGMAGPWRFDQHQHFMADGPIKTETEFFDQVANNLVKVKQLYPNKRILLESPISLPKAADGGINAYSNDPQFFKRLLKTTDSYFLFDVGHATVSAYNLGFKQPEDFFVQLPLERIVEIHIHRPRYSQEDGFWRDAHLPVSSIEFKSLEFVLARAPQLEAITIEAQGGHNDRTLIKELEELRARTAKY